MAARRPFWKWHRWKSIGFSLWPPSTCIWNLKLKFQSKLDLCSGNHVVYRQTDGQTDRRTRWIQYTSLGGGIMMVSLQIDICVTQPQGVNYKHKPYAYNQCHKYEEVFTGIRVPLRKIRLSWDLLVIIMGILSLGRCHLHIELYPCF